MALQWLLLGLDTVTEESLETPIKNTSTVCSRDPTFRASSVAPLSGSLVVKTIRIAASMAGSATITKGHLHPACGPAATATHPGSRS